MEKPKTSSQLKKFILMKEAEKEHAERRVKEDFQSTCTSLGPANLLVSLMKDIKRSPDLKTEMIKTVFGYITGFVTKKLFTPKKAVTEAELSEILLIKTIKKAVDNSSVTTSIIEKKIFKKLLYEYMISKE